MNISIKHIYKSFGTQEALNDINLEIKQSELFGLIGPDAAGKTSLFRLITTLLLPDQGSIHIGDFDSVKDYKSIRNIIGYMPGRFSLYQDLSVEENLNFYAKIFDTTIEANYDLIKDIYSHIEPFRKRRAGKLSGGMKQKLALSCALIHKPEILVLDEPTTGVDSVSRGEFWEMLQRLRDKGVTIIVSTPYMDEAILCDRVALIQKGKILTVNTPQGIVDSFPSPLYAIRSNNMYKLLKDIESSGLTEAVYLFGQYIHCILKTDTTLISLTEKMQNAGHDGIIAEQISPHIEDCFMRFQ